MGRYFKRMLQMLQTFRHTRISMERNFSQLFSASRNTSECAVENHVEQAVSWAIGVPERYLDSKAGREIATARRTEVRFQGNRRMVQPNRGTR
jgi:hypothetical protein